MKTVGQGLTPLSIKTRSALIIGATFLCLILGMYVTFSTAVIRNAEVIESDQMRDNVERVVRALQGNIDQLAVKTEDWAKWDDTYRFLDDRNKQYSAGNLTFETLSAIKLSHILYFDSTRTPVVHYEVDYDTQSIEPLTGEALQKLGESTPLSHHPNSESLVRGLVTINDKVHLVTSQPILDSQRSQPVKGALVFAMELGSAFAEDLAAQTRLPATMTPVEKVEGEDRFVLEELSSPNPFLLKRYSPELAKGYTVVPDIYGEPALFVSVSTPRRVFRQALSARDLTLFGLAGWGLVAIAVTILLLHSFVLAPLSRVTDQVAGIARSKDASSRIDYPAHDEFGVLASSMNSMLEALEEANRELSCARDQAEAANKAKTTFIAKVSHELRTPLNGIIGMLRIVLRSDVSHAVRHHLLAARHAADGLLIMINDILDFSKFQAGDIVIQRGDFSLVHLIRDALSTVGPKAYEREGVEVVARINPDVPERLHGDALRLKQIIVNLMANAVKFTSQGSIEMVIEKSLSERGDERALYTIRVRDTGCGIEQKRIATIFEPFTQADDSPARRYAGTGLGLTIVRQLTEAMGGVVEVESTLGKGTEFRVTLPLGSASNSGVESHIPSSDPIAIAFLSEKGRLLQFLEEMFQQLEVLQRSLIAGSLDPVELELRPQEHLLVDGASLERTKFMKHLELMIKINGAERICVALSPGQVDLKRSLAQLGITRTIHKPLLSTDIHRLLLGVEPKAISEDGDYDAAKYLGGARLRVLVAEDVLLNQTIMRDLFEANNIDVKIVDDGQQLLDAVAPTLEARARDERSAEAFDLILTDIYMPNVDGIEAARLIRERESALGVGHLGRVPIVALTANAFREEHVKMIEAGIDEVVTKPLEPVELWRKFSAFLQLNRIEAPDRGREGERGAPPHSASVTYPAGRISESGLRLFASRAVSDVLIGNHRDLPALQRWYALLCSTRGRLIDENQVDVEELRGEFWRFEDFARRLGGNPRVVQKSLDMFTGSYPEMLHVIELARQAKNEDALKRGIHTLSGVLAQLGCTIGWYLAKEAESNCYFNDWYRMDLLLKDLRLITEVFAQAVQSFTIYNTPNLGSEKSSHSSSPEKRGA